MLVDPKSSLDASARIKNVLQIPQESVVDVRISASNSKIIVTVVRSVDPKFEFWSMERAGVSRIFFKGSKSPSSLSNLFSVRFRN